MNRTLSAKERSRKGTLLFCIRDTTVAGDVLLSAVRARAQGGQTRRIPGKKAEMKIIFRDWEGNKGVFVRKNKSIAQYSVGYMDF